jgi:hypothetical protein
MTPVADITTRFDIADDEGRSVAESPDSYLCRICSSRCEPTWINITSAMFDLEICSNPQCMDRRAAQLASTEERYEGAQRDLGMLETALIEMLATDAGGELPHAGKGAEPVDVQLTESLRLALSALRSVSLIARRALTEVRSGHARRAEFQQAAVIAVALAGAR